MIRHRGISAELILDRYAGGVKLLRPTDTNQSLSTVGVIMRMPYNVYFLDKTHHIQAINDPAWSSCGFDSGRDALGNSMAKVCKFREQLHDLFAHDVKVIEARQAQIFSESCVLVGDKQISAVSLRMPWYSDSNTIIGIFGYSVMLKENDINRVGSQLAEICKFMTPAPLYHNNRISMEMYSKREREVIHWVVRGKTMRQIGAILGLSCRTIESYFENIKTKANVRTRSEFCSVMLAHLDFQSRF